MLVTFLGLLGGKHTPHPLWGKKREENTQSGEITTVPLASSQSLYPPKATYQQAFLMAEIVMHLNCLISVLGGRKVEKAGTGGGMERKDRLLIKAVETTEKLFGLIPLADFTILPKVPPFPFSLTLWSSSFQGLGWNEPSPWFKLSSQIQKHLTQPPQRRFSCIPLPSCV